MEILIVVIFLTLLIAAVREVKKRKEILSNRNFKGYKREAKSPTKVEPPKVSPPDPCSKCKKIDSCCHPVTFACCDAIKKRRDCKDQGCYWSYNFKRCKCSR